MSSEIATYQSGDVTVTTSPDQLIALALEKGADPATLEKLMDLQERWTAGKARQAFVAAMTGFKQEAPAVLVKGDKVDFGTTKYNYANLGSIVQEITALLGKYNLSASWETKQDEKENVVVTCHITHVAGHRESVTLRGPADKSGSKNPIQAIGSTVTYLQRYTLLAALGLATGEDDDGRQGVGAGKPLVTQPQRKSDTQQAPPAGTSIIDVIESVEPATGKKKDGSTWTKYGIKAGGFTYGTFDKKLAERAVALTGTKVKILFEQSGKFYNCTGIEEIGDAPAEQEEFEQKEAF